MSAVKVYTDAEFSAAMAWLYNRYQERGQFLSDDDVLDAADAVVPVPEDVCERSQAGDLTAELDLLHNTALRDALFEHLIQPNP